MNDSLVRALEELPREAWETPEAPPLVLPEHARPRRAGRRGRIAAPFSLAIRPAFAAAAAAALVACGVGAGVLISGGGGEGQDAGRAAPLARTGVGGPGAGGAVTVEGRTAVVDVARLAPSRRGDFYEVWLLTPPGKLVSLGSFKVPASGAARVRVPLPADPRAYDFFDISIEPDDGDPGHSSKSVLRGRTL
jgi:anti-sigma-K factor RskA